MSTKIQVTVDCADPALLVQFWSTALGYLPEPPPAGAPDWLTYWRGIGVPEDELDGDGCDSVIDPDGSGPRIWFQKVPEPKQSKNRLHLDLAVGGGRGIELPLRRLRVLAEASRLEAAGASRLRVLEQDGLDHFAITLQDPEGNEFCLH
jgi:hypothetical protein